jgi:hypothetical protein
MTPSGSALLAALVLLGGGCGSTAGGEGHAVAADAGPTGTLVWRSLREPTLTVVDLATGEATVKQVPVLAPGDALYHLVRTGGALVVYGGGATYSLDLEVTRPPASLGESWYFVPSAREGRVWLTELDPTSPDTVRSLRSVREVTVEGRVTVAAGEPPPCKGPTVLAAVTVGLLCQDDGLVLFDPATGKTLRRLGGSIPADTHDNTVAWCEPGCATFHVTDVATGEEVSVPPAASFEFHDTYDGAFSPDGSLLALPVAVHGREPALSGGSDGIALVDVRNASASLIEGSRSGAYAALAWSPKGDWLFFTSGDGELLAYRAGAQRAVTLPVEVRETVLEMVAGS